MAVFSGGKSLQGWFYAEGAPEFALLAFMGGAVRLGADPATWLAKDPDLARHLIIEVLSAGDVENLAAAPTDC